MAACTGDAWRIAVQRKWSNPRCRSALSGKRRRRLLHQLGAGLSALRTTSTSALGTIQGAVSVQRQDHCPRLFSRQRSGIRPTRGGVYYSKEGVADEHMPGQFGYNKLTDVRFPSSKTIMSDEWGGTLPPPSALFRSRIAAAARFFTTGPCGSSRLARPTQLEPCQPLRTLEHDLATQLHETAAVFRSAHESRLESTARRRKRL